MEQINSLARKTADIVEKITAVPLVIMGGAMVAVVLAGTFWRYVLNDPLLWTEEAARYLMIWVVLIGASITMRHREHVRINVIVNLFPEKFRIVLRIITNLFVVYFLYILTVYGWEMAQRSQVQTSPALGISMFWPILAVPLTGIFCLIQLVLQMVIDISGGEEQS